MKFLVDAQLPRRLAGALAEAGHDALHTMDLPHGNRTTDAQINEQADAEDRIVVSKDADFRNSHLLRGTPRRLLEVTTGNIGNADLLALVVGHLAAIEDAFTHSDHVELTNTELVLHPRRGA